MNKITQRHYNFALVFVFTLGLIAIAACTSQAAPTENTRPAILPTREKPSTQENELTNSQASNIVEADVENEAAAEGPQVTPTLQIETAISSPTNAFAPTIEVGNQSGVTGYSVGLFGSEFGSTQGTVTILGAPATVQVWESTFVQVIVPSVADGTGNLTLTTADAQSIDHPFTVYTIDPTFQQAPDQFVNIARGREAQLSGLDSDFCFAQPSNESLEARFFLTDFVCGFQGVNDAGDATFSTSGQAAVIAVDLEQDLTGELWLQTFTNSSWYAVDSGVMTHYQIQVSADSTNGQDGSWTTLQTIENNDRVSRLHRVTVPSGGNRWVRWLVTEGDAFKLREVRVFKPNGSPSLPDTFALYGDSLTAGAFEAINQSGFADHVKTLRGNGNDPLFVTIGLSGQNAGGLVDGDGNNDLYDAFALDSMETDVRYWGIALGTNDAGDGAAGLEQDFTNVSQFDERLEAAVADLISKGRVPIVARIPDTDESRGGFGDLEAKRKILADIDQIAADYRLIPGPDFYTPFRRNIETDSGSWLGGDGTHHTAEGEATLIDLWAKAYVDGLTTGQVSNPTPTPPPVNTPSPPPIATSTPIATIDPETAVFTYLPITAN